MEEIFACFCFGGCCCRRPSASFLSACRCRRRRACPRPSPHPHVASACPQTEERPGERGDCYYSLTATIPLSLFFVRLSRGPSFPPFPSLSSSHRHPPPPPRTAPAPRTEKQEHPRKSRMYTRPFPKSGGNTPENKEADGPPVPFIHPFTIFPRPSARGCLLCVTHAVGLRLIRN